MTKSKKAAISILLALTLLTFSSPQLLQHMTAYAQVYGAGNLYTTNWNTPNGTLDDYNKWGDEVGNVSFAFQQIQLFMQGQRYYYYYWYDWPFWPYRDEPVYWSVQDYSDQTCNSTVKSRIDYSIQNGLSSTDLYVGHYAIDPTSISNFSEDFENWNANNWGVSGNFYNETSASAHWGTHDAIGYGFYSQDQGAMWKSIQSANIVSITAYVKFSSLSIPQGERLELLDLQGGNWENSISAAITNPSGTYVWTLQTWVNGNINYIFGNDSPVAGNNYWYMIKLTRDLSNGQASLYVTTFNTTQGQPPYGPEVGNYTVLEASQNRVMTYSTDIVGAGLCWQSGNGNNMVHIDDVRVDVGPYKYGFLGHVPEDQKFNQTYTADATMDYDIYGVTSQSGSNEHFVFLWVCQNAEVKGSNAPSVHGMAYSWSNGAIYNDGHNDGYNYPDGSGYAFISFQGASPWLYEYMGTYTPSPNIFRYWLVWFYYFALTGWYSYTVNQALDMASVMAGYNYFGNAAFAYPNGGYWTYFPYGNSSMMPSGFYQGQMRVYGDGNIYLPQSDWFVEW